MSLTIKICKNTIILSNKAFSSLKETYLSFRDYLNLRHRCPYEDGGPQEINDILHKYKGRIAAYNIKYVRYHSNCCEIN